jgi:hypothetical protein
MWGEFPIGVPLKLYNITINKHVFVFDNLFLMLYAFSYLFFIYLRILARHLYAS